MALKLTAFAFILAAGTAQAEITADALVRDFTAQGYQRIEVKNGATQIKIEAILGSSKIEQVYDRATGALLKSERGTVTMGGGTGVQVRDVSRDFVRSASGSDDDDSNGSRRGRSHDDRGNSSDDSNDDNGSHGGNDDSGSHGGNDDSGSHDSNDDNGSHGGNDDSGSDDSDSGSDDSDDS